MEGWGKPSSAALNGLGLEFLGFPLARHMVKGHGQKAPG